MPWIIHQEAIKNQESIQSLVDFPASNSWRIAGNLLQPDMGPSILWDVPLPSLFPNPNPVFFFWRCRGGGSGVNSPSSFRVFSCFFFRSPADADQSILPLLAWYNGLDEPNGLATMAAYMLSLASCDLACGVKKFHRLS